LSAVKYGQDDTWPSHEKKHWHEPLAAAREGGWTLTYIDAPHLFGVVKCPAGEHSFAVDKTARGSETKAKEALKKISWCPHPAGRILVQRDESQRLLDVADWLIAEAEEGLVAAEAKRDAWQMLERIELQLDTAASNVDAVLLAEQDSAWEAAVKADGAPDPPILVGKLNEATVAVARSESLAKSVKAEYPGVARPLLDQAESVRAHVVELKDRVTALQEQASSDSG
jgi:hypothetical protein